MNRLRKLEEHNRWIYENLVNNKAKEKTTKIFNKDFQQKAVEQLKQILKECSIYDKELIELNKKRKEYITKLNANGKINISALVNNPITRENQKISLTNLLNQNKRNTHFKNNLQKYLLNKNKTTYPDQILEEIREEEKQDPQHKTKEKLEQNLKQERNSRQEQALELEQEQEKEHGKKQDIIERYKNEVNKNILKQIKDIKNEEMNKKYFFFAEHANYYDTHLKEKYIDEFWKELDITNETKENENDIKTKYTPIIVQTKGTPEHNKKEIYLSEKETYLSEKETYLHMDEDTTLMEKQENIYKVVNGKNDVPIQKINRDIKLENISSQNMSSENIKPCHFLDNNKNNSEIIESIPKEVKEIYTTKNISSIFPQNVENEKKETLIFENQKHKFDMEKTKMKNSLNEIKVTKPEYINFKRDSEQEVKPSNQIRMEETNKLKENVVILTDLNQNLKKEEDVISNSSPPFTISNQFNKMSEINKKEKSTIKPIIKHSIIPNIKLDIIPPVIPNKNNTIFNAQKMKRKKITEQEIDTMYLNKSNVFEKMINVSIYSNMNHSPSKNTVDIGISPIASILSDLKAKKEKENERNGQLNVGIKNEENLLSEFHFTREKKDTYKNSIDVDSSTYTYGQLKQNEQKNKKEKTKNGKEKTISNQLQQYQYLDSNNITIASLSNHVNVEQEKIINVCKYILDNDNVYKYTRLEKEVAELICEELNVLHKLKYSSKNLKKRNPIVTILGHVDHGKTTLLDQIRNSNIAKNEVGGITQKLGAFEILEKTTSRKITFLDTPGHSVFKKIRQRCVQCTDLIVLVISVDDGIMSETIECIQLAKKYNIPLIIAANKIDKYNYDVTRIEHIMNQFEKNKRKWFQENIEDKDFNNEEFKKLQKDIGRLSKDLLNYDIITTMENGSIQLIPISAKMNINVDFLKKKILEVSDNLNMMSDFGSLCSAYILEKKVDPVKGKSITAICKSGTLKTNAYLLIGHNYMKVKKLLDADGKIIKEAYPSNVVQIFGTNSVGDDTTVKYGDVILEMTNLKSAQKMAQYKWKIAQYNMLNEESANDVNSFNWKYFNKKNSVHEKENKIEKKEKQNEQEQEQEHEHEKTNEKGEEHNRKNTLFESKEKTKEKTNAKKRMTQTETLTLPQIHLIIKTCDEGSMEAIMEAINEYNNLKKNSYCDINNFIDRNYVSRSVANDASLIENLLHNWSPFKIVSKGIGSFNLSDLRYCEYIQPCFIIGFNIEIDQKIMNNVQNTNAVFRNHNIIYQLFDDLENMCSFYFDSVYVYEPIAKMVITKAGYYTVKKKKNKKRVMAVDIKEGTCTNKNYYTVIRNKTIIHNKITVMSMQKNKQNTTELSKTNNDNAIIFNIDSDDFQVGDEIIAYKKGNRPPLFNTIKTFDLVA